MRFNSNLLGHDAYYATSYNSRMLQNLRGEVEPVWLQWLNWRNRRQSIDWERLSALLQTLPLAPPRIAYSLWQSNPQLDELYG
jgi:hypothetical protein